MTAKGIHVKKAYPVILIPESDGGYCVRVPNLDCSTQGKDIADAIYMARDVIGLLGITLEDEHRPIPEPSAMEGVRKAPGEIVTYVDIDFAEYRRRNDVRAERKKQ